MRAAYRPATMSRLLRIALVTLALLGLAATDAGAQAPPENGSSDWRQVSVGGAHSCGIRTSGRLYCWGSNFKGQVGIGVADVDGHPVPTEVSGGFTDWTTVSAGNTHTCAIRRPGRLYCFGEDLSGQLGNGAAATADQPAPVQVGTQTTWTSVSASSSHTCGRRSNGRIYCWGNDFGGVLGNGPASTADRHVPALVSGGFTDWRSVDAGISATACGVRVNGRLYCWGSDLRGQLGNGPGVSGSDVPVQVSGNARNWASVSAGSVHTCATRTNRRLYCWGVDNLGQLGNGPTSTADRHVPGLVPGGGSWTAVAAGDGHTCGRQATGRLYCWGWDKFGILGDDGTETNQPSPVEVSGGATDWTQFSIDTVNSCARTRTGRLYCWGYDSDGRLGDGDELENKDRPSEVFA